MTQSSQAFRKVSMVAHFVCATTTLRFPCFFTILWKTADGAISKETKKAQTQQGCATFNQQLELNFNAPFDWTNNTFFKYETLIHLRLISKVKDNQPKLVGRKSVDLSTFLNNKQSLEKIHQFSLQYCSVNAVVSVRFQLSTISDQKQNYQTIKLKPNSASNATPPKSPPTLSPIIKLTSSSFRNSGESTGILASSMTRGSTTVSSRGQVDSIKSEGQNLSVEKEVKRLRQIQQELKKENQRLRGENYKLHFSLQENQQGILALESQLQNQKMENQRLRDQVRRKLDESINLQLQMATVKQQSSMRASKLAANNREQNRLVNLSKQLEQSLKQANDLKKKMKELQQSNFQWIKLNKQYESDLQVVRTDIQSLTLTVESLKAQLDLQIELVNKYRDNSQKQENLLAQQAYNKKKLRVQLQQRANILQNQIYQFQQVSRNIIYSKNQKKNQIYRLSIQNKQKQNRIGDLELIMINLQEKIHLQQQNRIKAEKHIQIIQKQFKNNQQLLTHQLHILSEQKQQAQQSFRLKIVEAQEELVLSKSQANQLSGQLFDLQIKYKELNAKADGYQLKIAELQEILIINNDIKSKELLKLSQSNNELELKIQQLQHSWRQTSQLSKKLEQKLIITQNELNERQKLIERLQEGLSKQVNLNGQLNQRHVNLSDQTQQHLLKISKLQAELYKIHLLVEQSQINEQNLRKRCSDSELQVYEILTAYQCLKIKHKQLEVQLDRKMVEGAQKMTQIQDKLSNEAVYIQNLQKQLQQKQNLIKELRHKLGSHQLHHRNLAHELRIHDDKLQQIVEEHTNEMSKVRAQLNDLRKREQLLNLDLSTKTRSLLNEVNKVQSMEKEIQNLKNKGNEKQINFKLQIQRLKIGTDQLQNQVQLLQIQRVRERDQEVNRRIQLSQTVNRLRTQLDQLSFNNGTLQSTSLHQTQRFDQEIGQLKNTINVLQNRIQQYEKQISAQKQLIQLLRSKKEVPMMAISVEEIVREKDLIITQLQKDLDRLASEAQQTYDLREKVQAYQQELQLQQDQREALDAMARKYSQQVVELREQNIRLHQQLMTITERSNDLQLQLYEMETAAQKQDIKIEVSSLKVKLKELENKNDELREELDNKEEQHVVELIDQHIRLSKSDYQNQILVRSNSRIKKEFLPDFMETCEVLKELLQNRKDLEISLSTVQQENREKAKIEDIPQYSRSVSLQIQKAKSTILKGDRKGSINEAFKGCEQAVSKLCSFVELCCLEQ